MINVKQAVEAAIAYTRQFADLMPTSGLRLEETELDDSGWNITLSFVENPVLGTRSYRVFEIDPDNGEVISMKARNILGQKR